MKKVIVQSNAKINLCLDITGIREDGYHLLDMVMVPIKLHDTLIIEETPRAVDNYITLDDFAFGDSQYNTVSQALDSLLESQKLDTKFKIDMHKVIPMKAGLGGGSSNAAFTLKAIRDYKKLSVSDEDLYNMSLRIGADVPFFIKNKPARCRGIGEDITPIEIKNDYKVLIVKPNGGCSTKSVYALCDKEKNWPHGNVDDVIEALKTGDDDLLEKSMFNVLEKSSIQLEPEIQVIKDTLKNKGLKLVLMSGSGSAVFALSTDHKLIKKVARELENKYTVIVTEIIK